MMAAMSAGAAAAGGGAAAAAIAQAIRASGVIVRVEPAEFLALLDLQDAPLVVTGTVGGMLFVPRRHQYLTSYKGLAFFAQSPEPLELPETAEVIAAQRIWIPG
jgi:hypothetical protein